jgi:hypothetical protein
MEPRRDLSPEEMEGGPTPADSPEAYFRKARAFAEKHYWDEMVRIWSTKFEDVSPGFFFMEYIWVVHATGFNAKVVAKMLPRLTAAYGIGADGTGWDKLGREHADQVLKRVLPVCNNPQKAKAVHNTAYSMCKAMFPLSPDDPVVTWEEFRKERLSTPELLTRLPYVGKITCHHLARNLGQLDSVKPDLHLVRLAAHWGFEDCTKMCEAMRPPEMPLGIVDLILWYASSTFGTITARKDGDR